MHSTYDLYLKIVEKPSKFCHLPSNIIEYHDSLIVHIISPILKEPLLLLWNKDLISKESNTIEISRNLLINNLIELMNNDLITIRLISNTSIAKDIELIPNSKEDWDIISTQANYIENNLLKTLFLVYKDQKLVISITPSIKASFIVQRITFLTNNLQSYKQYITKYNDNERIQIARIGNQTSLLIAPFVSKMPLNIDSNQSITSTDLNNISIINEDEDISNQTFNNDTFSPESIPYYQYSHTIPLQVLPQSYQFKDTRLLHKRLLLNNTIRYNNRNINNNSQNGIIIDDIYNESILSCDDEEEIDVENVLEQFEGITNFLDSSEQPLLQNPYLISTTSTATTSKYDNLSLCIVHPLYFILCFEKAMNQRIDNIKWNYIATFLDKNIILGDLLIGSSTDKSDYKILKSLVQIRFDERIRLGYCIVSKSIRLSLDIIDFADIRIQLYNHHHMNRDKLPNSIILTPIHWKSYVTNIYNKIDSTVDNSNSNNNNEYEEDLIKIELMQMIEQSRNHNNIPFLLYHTQLITMKLGINKQPSTSNIHTLTMQQRQYGYIFVSYLVEFHYPSYNNDNNHSNNNPKKYILFDNTSNEELLLHCTDILTLKKQVTKSAEDTCLIPSTVHERTLNNTPSPIVVHNIALHVSLFREFISPTFAIASEDWMLSRNANNLSMTTLTAATTTKLPISCFELYRLTCISILNQYISIILPSMFLRRVCVGISMPSIGMLCTGPIGSGMSTLWRELTEIMKKSMRTLSHTITIDCKELKLKPLDVILSTISSGFAASGSYPSMVLVLEHLDVLCPSCSKSTGQGMIQDERSSIVTIHIERLLRHYQTLQEKRFEIATAFKNVSLVTANKQSNESNHSSDDKYSSVYPYYEHVIASTGTDHALMVVATSESIESIAPTLLQIDCLHKHIEIQSLSPDSRLNALFKILSRSKVKCSVAIEDMNAQQRESLSEILLGYRICDINAVAKRICQYVFHTLTHCNGSISYLDLMRIISEYKPISSTDQHINTNSLGASGSIDWIDIAGYVAVKKSILTIIRNPVIYERLYRTCPIKLPRALLLYGPPGCGKTYIAQAAGKQFGLGFMSVRGPQLLDKFIGASEKAVRDLFQSARNTGRPSLIFFDEFESLAPKRGKDNTGVTDRIVNQLLTFIDGVESNLGSNIKDVNNPGNNQPQIFIIAATSRPDLIDVALLRPGRIEKHIFIGLPSPMDRIAILKLSLKKLEVQLTNEIEEVILNKCNHEKAHLFTAADWKAVVSTAYLLATQEYITQYLTTTQIIDTTTVSTTATSNNMAVSSAADNTAVFSKVTSNNTAVSLSGSSGMRKVLLLAKHLELSFNQTKPSIASHEMKRFQDIYTKFNPSNNQTPQYNHSNNNNTTSHNTANISSNSNLMGNEYNINYQKQTFH